MANEIVVLLAKHEWASRRLIYWWGRANEQFKASLGETPRVRFSDKLTRTAGLAYPNRNLIVLSDHFLLNETEASYDKTIGHEVAHVFANKLFNKRCGHGKYWRRVMIGLRLPPERCHQYRSTKGVSKLVLATKATCPNCQRQYLLTPNLKKLLLASKWHCTQCGALMTKENIS